jgi:hypothetical protein
MAIIPVGAELFHADRWTDGRTDGQRDVTKLTVTFCDFENSPKMIFTYFEIITFKS